ncbi:hypothetical protein BKA62DRAFT_768560 [Auriculariales sp. MPI-PUGE-AT-0066]|nr:hypothetical protein BKA62DRAFT_768560 [Auriculariales sp. MPI-PUGE-AT-0066]
MKTHEQNERLPAAMTEAGVSDLEFAQWQDVVSCTTFSEAVEALERRLASSSSLVPDWVLLHIFANKQTTREDAIEMQQYFIRHVLDNRSIDYETRAGCAVLTTHALARYGLDPLVTPIVKSFLGRSTAPGFFSTTHAFYANSFLIAMSRFPLSQAISDQFHQLVPAIRKQDIELSDVTLDFLLASRNNSLKFTQEVHALLREGRQLSTADRDLIKTYIGVLQKEGERGSIAKILTLLIAPDWNAATEPQPVEDNDAPHTPSDGFPPYFPIGLFADAYQEMTIFQWISYISQVARDPKVSGSILLDLYSFAQQQVTVSQPGSTQIGLRRALLPAIISGLANRGEAARAVVLWDEYLHRHLTPERVMAGEYLKLDRHLLGAGVNALCKAGRLSEAFETMNALGLRVGEGGYTGGRTKYQYPMLDPGDPTPRPRVPLSDITVFSFMQSCTAHRRPDVVFAMWDAMEGVWGTVPNANALQSILISASVAARLRASAPLREEMQYISYRMRALLTPWKRAAAGVIGPRGSADDPAHVIRGMLAEPVDATLWRGVPAWQRARYIFRTVLFSNWPELQTVEAPALPLREGEPADYSFGDRDAGDWRAVRDEEPDPVPASPEDAAGTEDLQENSPSTQKAAAHSLADDTITSAELTEPAFPNIIPNADVFHRYISMLGQCGRAAEIAHALAWMRQLNILPTTSTLAMALVYWRTVTDDAPAVEIYKDVVGVQTEQENEEAAASMNFYGSEYVKLVRWLHEWVSDRMPSDAVLKEFDRYQHQIIRQSE